MRAVKANYNFGFTRVVRKSHSECGGVFLALFTWHQFIIFFSTNFNNSNSEYITV